MLRIWSHKSVLVLAGLFLVVSATDAESQRRRRRKKRRNQPTTSEPAPTTRRSGRPPPDTTPPSKTLERATRLYDQKQYVEASMEFVEVTAAESFELSAEELDGFGTVAVGALELESAGVFGDAGATSAKLVVFDLSATAVYHDKIKLKFLST